MQKWIILTILLIITIAGILIVINVDIETEYVPEVEVEEKELRKTIISLYFKDNVSGEIVKETRMIDSKELLKNPYNLLIKMLIDGPESENNERVIPEGTKIIDTNFTNGCVNINLSKEFSENIDSIQLQLSKDSICKTLKELTEVTSVKFFVDGVEI